MTMLNGEWQNKGFLSGEIQKTIIDTSGEPQEKVVKPSTSEVIVEPDANKTLVKVVVEGVTADVDSNIVARNIRGGVEILGVVGDLEPDKPDQTKSIVPAKEQQRVVADAGYELASVTVEAIPSEYIKPSGTIEITANGIHSVKDYENANVDVPVPDLSETTATADDVLEGKEFFDASGEKVVGTYKDIMQQRVEGGSGLYYAFIRYSQPTINVSQLDTSMVTTMERAFGDTSLEELDLSTWDTSNVTTMRYMFYGSSALKRLNISGWNTSNVTNMSYLFAGCNELEYADISSFDTSKVTTMERMFYSTKFNLLDLSHFNLNKVTNMNNMFATTASSRVLTKVVLNGTKNVTNMGNMFDGQYRVTDISTIDMVSATATSNMFQYCKNLTNLTLTNIKISLRIGSGTSWGHLLTLDSLLNTIQELWTNTGTSTLTLTMGTANTAKLANVYVKLIPITDEMRAEDEYIDNKAPFEVCESTDEGAMLVTEYVTTIKKWVLA